MTVGEFKAKLEDASIDPNEQIQFYDKDGNRQEVTLEHIGEIKSIIPATPADPAYVVCKLKQPG